MIHLRDDRELTGLHFARDHKVMLFAEDVRLTLTNPEVSLPQLQHQLGKFEKVASFNVNKAKSKILNLTLSTVEVANENTNPRWATKHIACILGDNPTSTLPLYASNILPLLREIQSSRLRRWGTLPVASLG